MILLAKCLIKLGKSIPAGLSVDIEHLIPRFTSVPVTVQELATKTRKTFKEESFMEILQLDGGATSDGSEGEDSWTQVL